MKLKKNKTKINNISKNSSINKINNKSKNYYRKIN